MTSPPLWAPKAELGGGLANGLSGSVDPGAAATCRRSSRQRTSLRCGQVRSRAPASGRLLPARVRLRQDSSCSGRQGRRLALPAGNNALTLFTADLTRGLLSPTLQITIRNYLLAGQPQRGQHDRPPSLRPSTTCSPPAASTRALLSASPPAWNAMRSCRRKASRRSRRGPPGYLTHMSHLCARTRCAA
jgi:hypothetical protein